MLKIWCCLRCGHEWASRQAVRPKSCARCKASGWWRVARQKVPRVPGRIGRPSAYPVDRLAVGESMLLPWFRDASGVPDKRLNLNMRAAIAAAGKRSGKVYRMESIHAGLKVTRGQNVIGR